MSKAAMNDSGIQNFPIKSCVLSPLNVRKKRRPNSTTELEAMILAAGTIIQNLVGVYQMKGKKPTGLIEIVAGGRRLISSQNLLATGKITEDFFLPVKIVSIEEAVKLSLMENRGREEMHPADEYEAFQSLIDQGKTPVDVAAMYGVPPLFVKRCLKLANVSPKLLELFRNGEAEFSHMVALSVTNDHALQEAAWESIPANARTDKALRAAVTQGDTLSTDPLAVFVGIEAYEAAGGEVKRDLFDEHGTTLSNTPLLEKLALEKLAAHGEALRVELNLGWVECRVRQPEDEIDDLSRGATIERDLTAEENERIEALQAEFDEMLEKQDDLVWGTPEYRALEAKIDAYEEEIEEWQYRSNLPDPATAQQQGVFLYISPLGTVHRSRFLIRPVEVEDTGEALSGEDEGDAQGTTHSTQTAPSVPEKVRPIHSETLTLKLTAHRTAALQKLVMDNHHVALVLLAQSLVMQISHGTFYRQSNVSGIRMTTPMLKSNADDIQNNMAWQATQSQVDAALAELEKNVDTGNPNGLFNHLLSLSNDDLIALIAMCVGKSIDTTHGNSQSCDGANVLGAAVGLDMADWWKPTRSSYLSQVPTKRILSVISEGVSPDEAEKMAGMKKVAMSETAEKMLADTRWVPEILRVA